MSRPRAGRDVARARLWLAAILIAGAVLRLAYAAYDPGPGRFTDERYALANIRGIVLTGSLEPIRPFYPSPVFNLPPAVLVTAANAVSRVTGDERWLAIAADGTVHPAGYLACRLLQTVFSLVSLWLVFRIGRRLFSAQVGLVAAAMLAVMPWQIHAAGSFKPDAMLVATTLAALDLSLAAVASGRLAVHLAAGLAIAVAMGAKLTGGLFALPLVAATAIGWRERRRWLLLAAAGLTSAAAFVLMNPYWRQYGKGLIAIRRDYRMRARWLDMSPGEVPERVVELLVGGYCHGPVLGLVALAGLALLAVRAVWRGTGAERSGLVMLLVVPPAWVAAYALQTAYFKPNNFLPLTPLTALAGAWLLAELWRLAGERLPALGGRAAGLAAAGALGLAMAPAGVLYVYRSLTPNTEDVALRQLGNRLGIQPGRSLMIESPPPAEPRWEGRVGLGRGILRRRVERLDELAPQTLDRADGELFPETRLEGAAAEFYRRRVELRRPRQVHRFRPRLFELRGPPLVALIHRWRLAEAIDPLPLTGCDRAPVCVTAGLPADLEPGEHLSLTVELPFTAVGKLDPPPPLDVGGRRVALVETDRGRFGRTLATERLALEDPGNGLIRLEAGGRSGTGVQIALYRWLPRAASRPAASGDGSSSIDRR